MSQLGRQSRSTTAEIQATVAALSVELMPKRLELLREAAAIPGGWWFLVDNGDIARFLRSHNRKSPGDLGLDHPINAQGVLLQQDLSGGASRWASSIRC